MATPILMPLMGITMEEGLISRWLVNEGDEVKKGEAVVEFETEKINAEVEAPCDGIVGGMQAQAGEAVKVQGVIAYVLEPGESVPKHKAPDESEVSPPSPVPDPVSDNPVIRSDSASPEIKNSHSAPAASPIPSADVETEGEVISSQAVSNRGRLFATPLARKIARETGVDLYAIAGSGPKGRIVADDVRAGAKGGTLAAPPIIEPAGMAGIVTETSYTGVRKVIGDRMVQSLTEAAQVTLVTEADATEFVALRDKLAAQNEQVLGFRISYNDLLARICARALVEHPNMNARLEGEKIKALPYVNVGLAVDLPGGLVVVNVKNTQTMQLVDLAQEYRRKISAARDGTVGLDDMTDGTFTISNLGTAEIDSFTPVINPPECAILGVGRIIQKPAVLDGEIVVRDAVALSLTFDHRINDGAPAARFLQRIKQLVEQPYLLI